MKNHISYSYLHWIISLIIGVTTYSIYYLNFYPLLGLLIYCSVFSFILVLIPAFFCFVFLRNKYVRYIHLIICIIIIYITFFTLDDPDNDYFAGSILIVSSIITTFLLRNKFKLNEPNQNHTI